MSSCLTRACLTACSPTPAGQSASCGRCCNQSSPSFFRHFFCVSSPEGIPSVLFYSRSPPIRRCADTRRYHDVRRSKSESRRYADNKRRYRDVRRSKSKSRRYAGIRRYRDMRRSKSNSRRYPYIRRSPDIRRSQPPGATGELQS